MKVFLYKLFLIVIPFAVTIPCINYIIDPANLFDSENYVEGIATILSQGHNAERVSNYDGRLLKKHQIQKLDKTPNIVVFGASRIMELGEDAYLDSGIRLLNCGVSHANVYDLVAITGILDSLRRLPDKIIISVDPSIICEGGTEEWQSIAIFYDYMLRVCYDQKPVNSFLKYKYRKFKSLVSFEYFKQSLKNFKKENYQYIDIGTMVPKDGGIFSDGSISYPHNYMNPDRNNFITEAIATVNKKEVKEPDKEKIILLTDLLKYLQSKNVKLQLVMIPFFQKFYDLVNKKQNNLFITYENIFRKIAQENNIKIIGSFSSEPFELSEANFYDIYHCSRSAVKKVVTSQPLN